MLESAHLISPAATSAIHAHNCQDFYAAHERFESAWRNTSVPEREFYRALLLLTGGYFRLAENKPEAAHKFFSRSVFWISQFHDPYLGVDIESLPRNLDLLLTALGRGDPSSAILKYDFEPIRLTNPQEIA